ncbi:hypothetical protein [Sulfitobacter sp.]
MKPSILNLALASFLASNPAFAEERIEINNIYPLNQEYSEVVRQNWTAC